MIPLVQKLADHLAQQFPETVGHIPIQQMLAEIDFRIHDTLNRDNFLVEALVRAQSECHACDGTCRDNDGENWVDSPCPKCAYISQVLTVKPEESNSLLSVKLQTIRNAGWTVAVHNDYKLRGINHTFWLFTKGNENVKGEGLTDFEALDSIIHQLEARAVTDRTSAPATVSVSTRQDLEK